MQADCIFFSIVLMSTDYFDDQMIAIFFLSSEFSDFKKQNEKRKLASSKKIMSSSSLNFFIFLLKNSFMINSSMSDFLVSSLISTLMCLHCSKILKIDMSIHCVIAL